MKRIAARTDHGLQALRVIEVRLPGVHKGLIAARVLAGVSEPRTIIAMGNDKTDEDLFSALPAEAYAIASMGVDFRVGEAVDSTLLIYGVVPK